MSPQRDPPEQWRKVGETAVAEFFVDPVEPRVLMIWPVWAVTEDGPGARDNEAFSSAWFAENGGSGVVLVFVERAKGQDREARLVHAQANAERILGMGYVGFSPLARALLAFAMGLRRHPIPMKLFGSTDEAWSWALARIEEVG